MSDIVPLLLKEIPPERVTIMEELGRGAFGKVHKGILKEMPKVEVFFKPKEEREDHIKEGRVVAVKLLHGKESLHDIFAFSVMRAFWINHDEKVSDSEIHSHRIYFYSVLYLRQENLKKIKLPNVILSNTSSADRNHRWNTLPWLITRNQSLKVWQIFLYTCWVLSSWIFCV